MKKLNKIYKINIKNKMEGKNESLLTGYPNAISYECILKIKEQMEKNICKIKIGQEIGTGFFCKIPFPDKNNMLPVFVTNNHVINEKFLFEKDSKIKLDIKEETDIIEIDLINRITYTNEEYDITIIELKEEDNIKSYLELDDIIMNDILNDINKNKEFIDKTIYIIQYPKGELSLSIGILNNMCKDKKFNFRHKCCTERGSSGSPILNINNKVIGIHKRGHDKGINEYNEGTFLNYVIKDFIKKEILKNFNKKYNCDIESIKTNKLSLYKKNIKNEGLKYLSQIKFEGLKELDLSYNNISDINRLKNFEFKKIEILNLGDNKISDINILEKVNFKELKELDLSYNYISDIKILEKVKFEKLERLYLSHNKIDDINILENVNFKELKIIYLDYNNLSNIKVLGKVNFERVIILNLCGNKISDINILEKVNFKELKELYISDNNISDINILKKTKFEKIESLNLAANDISDINILEKVNFKNLKYLFLSDNNISDIKFLEKASFENLEKFDLCGNQISDIEVLGKVNFKNLKELNLYNNNISNIAILAKAQFEKLEKLNLGHNKIDEIKYASLISNLEYEVDLGYDLEFGPMDKLDKLLFDD